MSQSKKGVVVADRAPSAQRRQRSVPSFTLQISTFVLVMIVLVAFGLRVHQLDGQSLWNDEGLSLFRARQPLSMVISNIITVDGIETRDTNPPLYFLVLLVWRLLGGESVFALRFLGAIVGVMNVPLIYQLGKRAFNIYVGLVAAFLLAISPFHVWQSQELRNYSLLLFFNLLSVYGLFCFLLDDKGSRSWGWLVLWGLAGVAGIYTHYFGAFVLAFGIMALIWYGIRRSQWRPQWLRASPWLLILLSLIAIISIPVLWMGLSRFQAGPQIDFTFVPLHHLLSHAASAYGVGIIHGFVQPLWRTAPVVLLAAIGNFAAWRARNRQALILVLGYLFVPILLLVTLSALNPLYNGPRHLFMSLPPFLLLVAAGLVLPWMRAPAVSESLLERERRWHPGRGTVWLRAISVALGVMMIISQAAWLHTQFSADELVKDDLRGLADYLSQVAGDGDLILLHDTITGLTFDYYYESDVPTIAIPALWQTNVDAATSRLAESGEQADRVWFVIEPKPRTGFPRQVLRDWADEHWPQLLQRRFPSLWLSLNLAAYVPQPVVEALPAGATELHAQWADDLSLVGYELADVAQSGSFWQPVFYWSKEQPETGGYSISIRFLDQHGQIWAQIDQPLWRDYPPDEWPDGGLIRYQPLMNLPAGLPPGNYQVNLRVTRESDQQPLQANGDADLLLSPSLEVRAAKSTSGTDHLPRHENVGVRLGSDIELLGFRLPEGDFRPGHLVPVDLFWHVHGQPPADYQLRIELLDEQGEVIGENVSSPTSPSYPPTQWQPDELLRGQATFVVPSSADAGMHTVRVSLVDPETGSSLPVGWPLGRKNVTLGEVSVVPWPLVTELPLIARPLLAEFGHGPLIELHGYELSKDVASPADQISLTLFWRSRTDEMPASYTVFVHVDNAEAGVVTQGDGVPEKGFRPTTSWRDNEVIVDTHVIPIPPATEPGSYRLWVGLYDDETGLRLPAFIDGQQQQDDRLPLQSIEIEP